VKQKEVTRTIKIAVASGEKKGFGDVGDQKSGGF